MTAAARERLEVRVPLLGASAVAWLLLFVLPHGGGDAAQHAHHAHASVETSRAATLAGGSLLMFGAMMLPLLGGAIRHVRHRSLARRRVRAISLFVVSYGLPWIGAGVALIALAAWIVAAGVPAIATALVAIALWQCSPAKQRCLNRCHAHPELAAFGSAADRDVLRFGVVHGLWCVAACGGLMLLPMLFTSGHLLAMALVTIWLAGERIEKPALPRWRWRGPGKVWRIAVARLRHLSRGAAAVAHVKPAAPPA